MKTEIYEGHASSSMDFISPFITVHIVNQSTNPALLQESTVKPQMTFQFDI